MKIAVVGAGLAGLATGHWLSKKGYEVEIFEATGKAGGRAVTLYDESSESLVDVGSQYFHSNYRLAKELISEVGLSKRLRKINGKTRFFDDRVSGHSYTTGHRIPYIASGSAIQNISMIAKGLCRLALNPIKPFSVLDGNPIDGVRANEKVTDPFEWEYNARALIMAGALIEPEASSISYLHLLRLMRIIVMSDYLSLDGGIASLHHALADKLAINYRTPIKRLSENNGQIDGIITGDNTFVEADQVVIATTPNAAAKLIPDDWQTEKAFLEGIEQPPAIVATFFLNTKLEEKVWSYVFRQSPNRLVSFCVDAAMKNPTMTAGNNSVLQAWICSPASEAAITAKDKQLESDIISELEAVFPLIRQQVTRSHIHRVEQAIPQMPINHNQNARIFLEAVDQRANVEFCGDFLSGGYMECALWSAKRAVDRISNNPSA